MPKPASEWTEDDVLALPSGENDSFERKGAPKLDLTLPGVNQDDVLNELAKQLSAFANMGGGQIIYGITDAGAVDNGGIPHSIKGRQPTKEWLEDVIPKLTEYEIGGLNVYEIQLKSSGSQLGPEKAIFVVDVPDSERAPHQSARDKKYYVRLGAKSIPAPHRMIEDIRNRAKHPRVEIHDLQLASASLYPGPEAIVGLKSRSSLDLSLTFGIHNVGMVRASSACLRIAGNVPLSTSLGEDGECLKRSSPQGVVLFELKHPLYPGMGVNLRFPLATSAEVEVELVGSSLTLSGVDYENVELSMTVFADSAPARRTNFNLAHIDTGRSVDKAISEAVKRIRQAGRTWAGPDIYDPSS